MNLSCHICGMRFRSMSAEAKHRHNFPALCRRPTLSPTQERALEKFRSGAEMSAYEAKEQLPTLRALVSKGLLRDVTPSGPGRMFSPRSHIKFVINRDNPFV